MPAEQQTQQLSYLHHDTGAPGQERLYENPEDIVDNCCGQYDARHLRIACQRLLPVLCQVQLGGMQATTAIKKENSGQLDHFRYLQVKVLQVRKYAVLIASIM